MKMLTLFAAGTLLLLAQTAAGKPVKTLTQDPRGTSFVVAVDWETRLISVRLRANPARLHGNILEESMQLAVGYSSAIGCQILRSGRQVITPNEIIGVLHCPAIDGPE